MRDRHVPRLCDLCRAPMARQEAACWSCGTRWADEGVPRAALRVIAGGAGRGDPEPTSAGAAAEAPAAAAPGGVDADRWTLDGGSLESEPAAQVRLTTARR
jgi:hypothetical protein